MIALELDLHYNVAEEDSLWNECKCGFVEADDTVFGQHVRRENAELAKEEK